jgi:hypothetical protein
MAVRPLIRTEQWEGADLARGMRREFSASVRDVI